MILLLSENQETEEEGEEEEEEEGKTRKNALRRECVDLLLSDDASSLIGINQKDKEGMNALHYLCRDYKGPGLVSIAQKMLGRGVNVNEKSYKGWTVDQYAARFYGNYERDGEKLSDLLRLFIAKNANLTDLHPMGWTNLHMVGLHYQKTICST